MKGGKKGRKRRSSGGDAKRKPGGRAPTSDDVTRPWTDAPKKGTKGKSYGGRSSKPEE